MRKVLKSMTAVAMIVAFSTCEMLGTSYAEENFVDTSTEDFVEEMGNFTDSINEMEYIEKKVNDECDAQVLEEKYSDIEEYLNEKGIFDNEIKASLTQENIDDINNCDLEDVQVYTSYYLVPEEEFEDVECDENFDSDTSQEKNDVESGLLNEEEMIKLTDEEVNMYLADKYYGEEYDIETVIEERLNVDEEDSIIDEISQAIGFKPVEVLASDGHTIKHDGKSDTMLKKSVYSYRMRKDTSKAHIKVTYTWDKGPKYRALDNMEISLSWCNIQSGDANKIKGQHVTVYDVYDPYCDVKSSDNIIQTDLQRTLDASSVSDNEFFVGEKKIIVAIKMHPNYGDCYRKNWKGDIHNEIWNTEYVYIDFDVKMNEPGKNIQIVADYNHVIPEHNKPDYLGIVRYVASLRNGDPVNLLAYNMTCKVEDIQFLACGDRTAFLFAPIYK